MQPESLTNRVISALNELGFKWELKPAENGESKIYFRPKWHDDAAIVFQISCPGPDRADRGPGFFATMDFYDHGRIDEIQALQLINLATQGFNAVVMLEDNGVLVRQAFFPSTTHAEIARELKMTTFMVTNVFHAAVMTIAKGVSGPEAYRRVFEE